MLPGPGSDIVMRLAFPEGRLVELNPFVADAAENGRAYPSVAYGKSFGPFGGRLGEPEMQGERRIGRGFVCRNGISRKEKAETGSSRKPGELPACPAVVRPAHLSRPADSTPGRFRFRRGAVGSMPFRNS